MLTCGPKMDEVRAMAKALSRPLMMARTFIDPRGFFSRISSSIMSEKTSVSAVLVGWSATRQSCFCQHRIENVNQLEWSSQSRSGSESDADYEASFEGGDQREDTRPTQGRAEG